MGDHGGHQRTIMSLGCQDQTVIAIPGRGLSGGRRQMLRKAAACIDLHQELFNANSREVAPHQLAQRRGSSGFTLAWLSAQSQTSPLKAGKWIGGPVAFGLRRGAVKL